MKVIWSLLILLAGFGISLPAGAQADQTLTVKTDLSCNWKLDGKPMGLINGHDSTAVLVSSGEHLISATTTDGVATVRSKVEVADRETTVALQLKDQIDLQTKMQEQAVADTAVKLTWTDPATGLMWAKKDNGSDLDWNQATAYCSKSRLAGFDDWRLPSIDELQEIYDPSAGVRTVYDNGLTYNVRIKGHLRLAGSDWSSSLEDRPQGAGVVPWAWFFNFGSSQQLRADFPLTMSFSLRALCVRRSAE